MSLDGRNRSVTWRALAGEEWDLLVIGGGITGAGIALDAASRGMRVALVEMDDFASGTSSRSTKLIHGGLRYLKQFEFKLVSEVGRERAILHRSAGHVVLPEQMLLPIVEGGTFGGFALRWGLWLYDWLAGVRKEERRRMLRKEQALAQEPGLNAEGLQGAGLYSEYRTDDARLVIETVKTAVRYGAVVLNHARVKSLIYKVKDGQADAEGNFSQGNVAGAMVEDMVTRQVERVRAKLVVNAAGPWVDGIREMDGSCSGKRLHHTKGVHLVVDRKRLPLKHSVYFDVGDGRMIFAIPRDIWTYFGTTDTDYKGPLDQPQATSEDVDYLVGAVNRMFPAAGIMRSDIESSWAGIRPLIHEDGKAPGQLSRKDELFFAESGLITIAGGKLTGFRKMAEKVVDVVAKRLRGMGHGATLKPCHTDMILYAGNEYASGAPRGRAQAEALVAQYRVDVKEAAWLVGLYGSNAGQVLKLAGGSSKLDVVRGAVRYSIAEEGVATLSDFYIRRSALLYFGRRWIEASLPSVLEVFGEAFGPLDVGSVFGGLDGAAQGGGQSSGSSGYDPDPGGEFARAFQAAVDFR